MHPADLTRTGGTHASPWSCRPLTREEETPKSRPVSFTGALNGATQIARLPAGALLGLVGAGSLQWIAPELAPNQWNDAPVFLACVAGGVLVQRAFHYSLGWLVDTTLAHLAARRTWLLALERLREHQRRYTVRPPVVRALEERLVRASVNGEAGSRPKAAPQRKPAAEKPKPATKRIKRGGG
jgi:hypothetical protein